MADGTVFFLLLLIGIAVAAGLGFVIGEDHGWKAGGRDYRRLAEESIAKQQQRQASS